MSPKQSKFQDWYSSPSGQKYVGIFYSLGASVVIIGALFKILHWPGASQVLMVGMITEALLFAIGIFEKPHKAYHWENVFPILTQEDVEPMNFTLDGKIGGMGGGSAAGVVGGSYGSGAGAASGSVLDSNKLPSEDAKRLSESIKELANTAEQLTGISKVAGLTESYAKNISDASDAAAAFASKQQNLDKVSDNLLNSYQTITNNLANVQEGTNQYVLKSDELNKSLSAINTVYEMQLKNVQHQADVISTQTTRIESASADLDKMQSALSNSAKDMDSYRTETEKLAKQVSDLNNVYGNMLNAIRR